MKQALILFCLMIGLFSCNNEETVKEKSELDVKKAISESIHELYASKDNDPQSIRLMLSEKLGDNSWLTESENNFQVSEDGKILSVELQKIDASIYETKADYINALYTELASRKGVLSQTEYNLFDISIFIISETMDAVGGNGTMTKGWWSSWGRCAAGITGGGLLGGLTGAGVGSVVPVVGTVAGGIVGVIGGGLSGAAAAC